MSIAISQDIPESTLNQAIGWAVLLGSGTSTAADQAAFERWLHSHGSHRSAWERLQVIDLEFNGIRSTRGATAALRRAQKSPRGKRAGLALGGLLVLLLSLTLVLSPVRQRWTADYVAAQGTQQELSLPGGAIVYLNGGASLDIEHTDQGIEVHLRGGEILVDSSAATRPFKPAVVTADGRFIPLGTRFLVDKHALGSDFTLLEGEVVLQHRDGESMTAHAGEWWRLSSHGVEPLSPTGLAPAAWLNNVIEADNAPLSEVLDALGRQHAGWLRYDDVAAELRVTGVFRQDDVESALLALHRSLPVRISSPLSWWVRVEGMAD